jgi:hypothetical protein
MNETAALCDNCGPPLRPQKRCPASVKTTVSTMRAGHDGVSTGERLTASMGLPGSSLAKSGRLPRRCHYTKASA